MKPLRLITVLVVSVALGLVLGAAVRRHFTRNAGFTGTGKASTAPAVASAITKGQTQSSSAERARENALQQKDHQLAISAGVTRWLYWMEALEKASLDDMPRLARLARNNASLERLVVLRWIELDPKHMLNTLIRGGESAELSFLGFALLSEWARKDPKALVEAMDQAPDFGPRSDWRRYVAGKLFDTDPEQGLALMSRWQILNHGPSTKAVAKWAAANPKHAAEFVLTHPAGYASDVMMQSIGAEWTKIDPSGPLEFAKGKKDELTSILASSALKTWAQRDLAQASDWLARADAETRNRLSAPVVEGWAEKDPAAALVWSESNLTGSALTKAVAGALKSAGEKDIQGAARLVEVMQPSSARTSAALAVAEKWLPGLDAQMAPPAEALQWLRGLDPESLRKILEARGGVWSQTHPQSLAAFLSSVNVDHIPTHVYARAAVDFARFEPERALEWVQSIPPDARAEAGGDAFATWRQSQPDTAMTWWHNLRREDPRRKPYLESALRRLLWDPLATDQFLALAALDQASARGVVEKWAGGEQRNRLLSAIGAR